MPTAEPKAAPSTARIVAAMLLTLLVAMLIIVAGIWLWNESLIYRGNGTPYPSP